MLPPPIRGTYVLAANPVPGARPIQDGVGGYERERNVYTVASVKRAQEIQLHM